MKAYQAQYTVAMLCRVLEVSESGCYAWCKRPPSARRQSDLLLGDRIEALFRASQSTYGRSRLHADLREEGSHVSGKRVARLMHERQIQGLSRRKSTTTTIRDRDARPAPDLVDRNFRAQRPDQLWVADITVHPGLGRLLVSRGSGRCLQSARCRLGDGQSPANRAGPRSAQHGDLSTSSQECDPSFRSRLSVYVIAFALRCREANVRPSMGSIGDAYDNAMCESFNATLECELLARHSFKTQR